MHASNKLPRKVSLKSRREIGRLLKEGKKLSGAFFTAYSESSDQFGYAVLVGRRHGSAVDRNRIKRIFREAIRLERNHLARTVNLVIIPKYHAVRFSFQQIDAEISRLFGQINAGD